jgi:hypothetical protein
MRAEAALGLPCGRSGQIDAQVRRHVVHDPLESKPLEGPTKPVSELAIGVKIERLASNRGALHDLAFTESMAQRRAICFWPSLNLSTPPRSAAMLASTSRNRRETLSRASPSMHSCRPLVTLLRPFGARETIWLASFRS